MLTTSETRSKLVHGHPLDALLSGEGLGPIRIVGHHLHLKPLGAQGHALPDGAQADEAEGLLPDFHAHDAGVLPPALPETPVAVKDLSGHGEHEGEGVVGHGLVVDARRVKDHGPVAGGGRDVHGVQAGPHLGHGLEPRGHGQHPVVHPQVVAAQDGIGPAQGLDERGVLDSGTAHVDDSEVGRPEFFHGGGVENAEGSGLDQNGEFLHGLVLLLGRPPPSPRDRERTYRNTSGMRPE